LHKELIKGGTCSRRYLKGGPGEREEKEVERRKEERVEKKNLIGGRRAKREGRKIVRIFPQKKTAVTNQRGRKQSGKK